MKLTIAMIMLTALQVMAGDGRAQNVTLQMKKAEIPKVFRAIEKQSTYRFLYNYDLPELQKKVDVDVKNTPVITVLNDVLTGSGLSYRIINNQLVVIMSAGSESAPEAKKVSGRVAGTNGEPLAGVSVRIKGSNYGTTTDEKGFFSIDVPDNAVLLFSYVGFETQEIAVAGQSSINITLKQEERQMDQVVVVGYGTQRKKDLTGSVSSLSSKDLENRPATQFGYAIEGKAAGVQVIRSSGQPQAGFSIRIRGTSSITAGSNPLYIVDGVPMEGINEINPADIENITILKDASSAAIYGNRGANGVVLVTTKRGKVQKLKLGFNTSLTMSKAWKKMDVLNSSQFKDLATEMGATTDWNKYNANTDWQGETFRNALTQNYQLSATGGTKSTTYYLSGAWVNQNGIILNNNLKRATLKANVDQQVTKFLKMGVSLSYSNWKDRDVPENYRNGVIARLLTTAPIIGIRDLDEPGMYARSPFINDLENPVSTVYQPDHIFKNNRYSGNIYAEAEVKKGLKLKTLFGFEKSKGDFTSFQDTVQTRYGRTMHGLATENNYDLSSWISENTINYSTKIKEHNIAALGGFIVSRQTTDNLYRSSVDFRNAKGGDNSVDGGSVKSTPVKDKSRISSVAFIARLNYNYKDKYYLTTNFRQDGSGRFAPDNKWGSFPSFSAGWRISEESFFGSNDNFISELKLRAGWGIVGNDAVPANARFGIVDTASPKYLINNAVQTAYVPRSLENVDLTWEKTNQVDIGIDLGLFQNRLLITADYYHKKTTDMLLAVPIPTSTGYSSAWQNAGSLQNKGFEFSFTSKNIVRPSFKWSSDFNISFNKNKVLDIVGTQLVVGAINPAGSDYNTAIVKEGEPLGSFYGKVSQGVDPATGNIIFLKKAGSSEDSVGIIGYANPKFTYGFSNSLSWNNFSLDIFFQGVSGNKVMNATRVLTESMALVMNQSSSVLNRWKNPGDKTDMPKVTPNNWDNSLPSTRYIENGSYLRLKALTLGYRLPEKLINKARMSRCFVYFTAENLFTFTKYNGFDPELSAFSGKSNSTTNQNAAPGVDWGTYPQSRDFILGVNISF
ncbi:MAG: TonB-dependent receptor [Chitinophagaceae bacterium]|nr:TonB-dependent receptor [Chitinophagaceae bacterium]